MGVESEVDLGRGEEAEGRVTVVVAVLVEDGLALGASIVEAAEADGSRHTGSISPRTCPAVLW
jgi:hypothetical protein